MHTLTEDGVIELVAKSLDIPTARLSPTSRAAHIPEWDSLGLLGIIALLDREGIKFDIGDAAELQSMEGILNTFRRSGKLR